MAAMTDYTENILGDHVLRGIALPTFSADLQLRLYISDPTDTGTAGTECTYGGYAPATVPRAQTTWNGTHGNTTGPSTGTSGLFDNAIEIIVGNPPTSTEVITHWTLYDITLGQALFHGALTNPKTVNNGDPAPKFTAAALGLTWD